MYATELICRESKPRPPFFITNTFLDRRTEINSDGSKHLNLHGRQLDKTIGRRIEDTDIEIICNYLADDTRIITVDLCYNNITNEGMSHLTKFLEHNKSVEYLDLMMNNIEADGIKVLAALGDKLKLTALRLNGNKFGQNGGIYLAELLEVNKSLQHLDIAETDQTVISFVHIMTVMRSNKTVKCLDISRVIGVLYYVLDIDHIIQVLSQMLLVNDTLTELHLQKMEITDFVLDILTEGLRNARSLLLLDLSCNQIGDNGIDHIGKFLTTSPPLQAIMLNHNRIRNSGAKYLGYTIAFSKLRFLDVAHNRIGEEGILSLLHTIRKEHNLVVLFLFGNSVTGKALLLLELWLQTDVLKVPALDTCAYRDEFGELKSAYNSEADMYNQRYYKVVGKLRRKVLKPKPSPSDLAFNYHNIMHVWQLPQHLPEWEEQ